VFSTAIHFRPNLIFVGKARSPLWDSTRVGSYLSRNCSTRSELNGSGKHSSLLQYGNIYGCNFLHYRPLERQENVIDVIFCYCLFLVIFTGIPKPWNTERRGKPSTIGLLIKVACFVTKVNNILNIKMSWCTLACIRRSTVLSLLLQ
jgi:hypothetical protein